MTTNKPLNICFVTDNKPGHKNQLLGLEQSLKLRTEITGQWLSVADCPLSWWDVLFRRAPVELSEVPDLIVAAGSASQKLAYVLKRKYGAFLALLMRPNILPYGCFDAVIVPEHDNPPQRDNVYTTIGVLNKIRPSSSNHSSGKGLILVGGESKHYHWSSDSVLSQIDTIIQQNVGVKHWLIGDSRRTPADFRASFNDMFVDSDKVGFCAHEDTDASWLPQQMAKVDTIWVTPDSVSMVYEALTSGKPTGVFKLDPQKNGRIVQGITRLAQQHKVMTVDCMDKTFLDVAGFCEADRVADWLLEHSRVSQ